MEARSPRPAGDTGDVTQAPAGETVRDDTTATRALDAVRAQRPFRPAPLAVSQAAALNRGSESARSQSSVLRTRQMIRGAMAVSSPPR